MEMTEIEKLILKSLKGTTMMQCEKVKYNPKAGLLFLVETGWCW